MTRDGDGWMVVTAVEDAIIDLMGDAKFPSWDAVRSLAENDYAEVEQIPFTVVREAGLMRRGMRYSKVRLTVSGRAAYDEWKYERARPDDWDERLERIREPDDPERDEMRERMRGAMSDGTFRAFWKYRTLLRDLRLRGAITDADVSHAENRILKTRSGTYNVRGFERHVIELGRTAIRAHPQLFRYAYGEAGETGHGIMPGGERDQEGKQESEDER